MDLIMIEMNYVGYVVAGVASILFGVLWYGPLFGEVWANSYGVDVTDKEAMDSLTRVFNARSMLSTLCMYIFEIMVIGYLLQQMDCKSVTDGCYLAAIIWCGFGCPLTVIKHSYNPLGMNKAMLLFDLMYQLLHSVGLTSIIVYFRNW